MGRDARPDDPRAEQTRHEAASNGRSAGDAQRREPMRLRGRAVDLRQSELNLLETVGTFRVVPEADVEYQSSDRSTRRADLRALETEQLIARTDIGVGDSSTTVVTLTKDAVAILEAREGNAAAERPQRYYSGVVKPRELLHDKQLYRLYLAEAERIGRDGGRVARVALDYELKREYQRFLNRSDRRTVDEDRATFAAEHQLPIVRGHLEIPDLRIEYVTEDGRIEYRDVELVTEHYSRSQMAGKRASGFALYRAAGGSSRPGGTPHDPRNLVRLL